VGKSHPSFYAFLRELQKEQSSTETLMEELDLGRPIRDPQKRKYKVVTERLQRITLRYEKYKQNEDVLRYLRACGALFTL